METLGSNRAIARSNAKLSPRSPTCDSLPPLPPFNQTVVERNTSPTSSVRAFVTPVGSAAAHEPPWPCALVGGHAKACASGTAPSYSARPACRLTRLGALHHVPVLAPFLSVTGGSIVTQHRRTARTATGWCEQAWQLSCVTHRS